MLAFLLSVFALAQCEFVVGGFDSKPSSQGRLEGATGMYLCVFEPKPPTTNGLKSTNITKPNAEYPQSHQSKT